MSSEQDAGDAAGRQHVSLLKRESQHQHDGIENRMAKHGVTALTDEAALSLR
jgi:hypothetical protein